MSEMSHEERLTELEKKFGIKSVELDFRLLRQDEVLKEIKNVLIKQTDLLNQQQELVVDIIRIQEKITDIEQRHERLSSLVQNKSDEITPLLNDVRDFMGKFRGMIMAGAFFFSIIQAGIGFFIYANSGTISNIQTQQHATHTEVTTIKAQVENLRSQTPQTPTS